MYRSIPALILLSILLLLAWATPSPAAEGEFYQWTNTESGALEFADSVKSIPAAYRASAKTRTWEELANGQAKRMTPMQITAEEYAQSVYLPGLVAEPEVNPNQLNDCTGPVTIHSERVQVDDHNRTMYHTVDECGRTSTYTPNQPRMLIER